MQNSAPKTAKRRKARDEPIRQEIRIRRVVTAARVSPPSVADGVAELASSCAETCAVVRNGVPFYFNSSKQGGACACEQTNVVRAGRDGGRRVLRRAELLPYPTSVRRVRNSKHLYSSGENDAPVGNGTLRHRVRQNGDGRGFGDPVAPWYPKVRPLCHAERREPRCPSFLCRVGTFSCLTRANAAVVVRRVYAFDLCAGKSQINSFHLRTSGTEGRGGKGETRFASGIERSRSGGVWGRYREDRFRRRNPRAVLAAVVPRFEGEGRRESSPSSPFAGSAVLRPIFIDTYWV